MDTAKPGPEETVSAMDDVLRAVRYLAEAPGASRDAILAAAGATHETLLIALGLGLVIEARNGNATSLYATITGKSWVQDVLMT